jgi:hypothetical protein
LVSFGNQQFILINERATEVSILIVQSFRVSMLVDNYVIVGVFVNKSSRDNSKKRQCNATFSCEWIKVGLVKKDRVRCKIILISLTKLDPILSWLM